jgi:hypothetical protein
VTAVAGVTRRAAADPAEPPRTPQPAAPAESVMFEYTGKTGLTAIGTATGRRYRFGAPGTAVAVDLRDAASLSAVPHLRRASR